MSRYVELHCHSCFSLLDGASTPEALIEGALALGMPALALTDHDGLYAAVRFWLAARERGLHPVIGAEVTLEGGDHLVLLAENRTGYGNLSWLITGAQLDNSKGNARLKWEVLRGRTEGLIALTACGRGTVARHLLAGDRDRALAALGALKRLFGPRHLYVELQQHLHRGDAVLAADLAELAADQCLPIVATNDIHYAQREGHRLYDILVAIRHNASLYEVEGHLRPNSEYFLKAAPAMETLFEGFPGALDNTLEIAERCNVGLNFRAEALPSLPGPAGQSSDVQLSELCHRALSQRYPGDASAALKQLEHELDVIRQTALAGYFLLVWDIVHFAGRQGIQVRGRGSAANSIVAYLLGITNVDPLAHNLLFERFLNAEARIMPDIDLDFCSRRREEVIQYVYDRYGDSHVAMVCNYVTYRGRSARRDVGKALGLAPQAVDPAAGSSTHSAGQEPDQEQDAPSGSNRVREQFQALCEEIQGLPRHLGIHVGGMCITSTPLDELVPLERATMPGRVVTQWDKDGVEDAGLIKIDLLSLRTLSAVEECLDLIERHREERIDLDALPLDDPAVYQALQRSDTIGTFQVESRAQQQALVRMKPRHFCDLVVEVAIIRPGPLQGGMVNPFFKRRMGLEPVTYPHPCLQPILEETLGVIVFQEQVIRIAMVMGKFSPGEADMLRRSMSRRRSEEEMASFRDRFVSGAAEQDIPVETADAVFDQLLGFASFGFCKSHAAAFARTAYDTLYLCAHYPAEYYCSILNNQPMGFYPPHVIVNEARRRDVPVRPVHLNRSEDGCTVEEGTIRLGFRYVSGLGQAAIARVLQVRDSGRYRGLADFCHRTRLPRRLIENLVLAGAIDDWNPERRRSIWELGRLRYQEEELPLSLPPDEVVLERMTYGEKLVGEYRATGVATDGHLMELYRDYLSGMGIWSSRDLKDARAGQSVCVAGLKLIRQAPPTAKGFVFFTLEDEWGLMNIIVKPDVFEAQKPVWTDPFVLIVRGTIQRTEDRVDVLAQKGWELHSASAAPNSRREKKPA